MKKRYFFTLLFFVFLNITAKAQIENEIKNYVDSTEILINNGRKFLAKTIQSGDLQKSQEVFHFLMMEGEERNCWSFSFKEQLLLNVVFKDASSLLSLMQNNNENGVQLCYRNMEPIEDVLYSELRKNKPTVEHIKSTENLKDDDVDVLKILFYFIENGAKNDVYDRLIRDFKKKYPQSKYTNFVKGYLPAPTFKASISYSLGSKYDVLTGNYAKYFHNPISLSFGMDFCVSKVYVSLYVEGSDMKLIKPIVLSQTNGDTNNFNDEDIFTRMDIGLKTGYCIVRNKNLLIAPYAALLAGSFLNSDLYSEYDINHSEYDFYDGFMPSVGVHFEYKLGDIQLKSYNPYINQFDVLKSYWSLKFDLGYTSLPKFNNSLAAGNLIYASVGLVYGLGTF